MVSESSTNGVLPSKQTAKKNPSLLQDKELTTKFSPQNTIFPASKLSTFLSEPQSQPSRKRPRICEQQPSFQQSVAANPVILRLSDKNTHRKQCFHFVSWPDNFTFQSNEVNKSVQLGSGSGSGSETKQPSFSVKNHQQLPGKTSASGVGMNLRNAGLFVLDGNNVGSENTEVDSSVDFSRAIEDAISRIESLIPSLQKLVKNDHSLEPKSVDHSASPLGKEKDLVATNDHSLSRTKGPLHSKVAPHDQISEETSWNLYISSDSTAQQSGSPSYSSGDYESSGTGSDSYDGDESEPLHEKVGYSKRMKQPEFTDSAASGYDATSSYSNSRDDYSEVKSSSQMSSARLHKWDPQKERGKRRGRLKRLGRKLGMIFHHHHHHHHHHHYRDEPAARHARSFWNRLGEMFHHSRNTNHHQKRTSEKPRKSEVKTVAKRKQQQGHFHALLSGLMKHMKHSKKPKQVKNGFKGLGSDHHGGKKKGKKLPWWPKVHGGRGGVKVSSKGKFRLANYRTKSFAAAKMILKK